MNSEGLESCPTSPLNKVCIQTLVDPIVVHMFSEKLMKAFLQKTKGRTENEAMKETSNPQHKEQPQDTSTHTLKVVVEVVIVMVLVRLLLLSLYQY